MMNKKNADHYFLQEGGEMGGLIRAKDWSKTPLGDPADWPQSLCTIVAVMLENPFGMHIAWGDQYTQLYNDGYRPILGATKHPHALGNDTRESFPEVCHIIEPMFDDVMKGKATRCSDFMFVLNRNGFDEECYFDFSYSPIRMNDGTVGGVLTTVIETTYKKKDVESLMKSEEQFKILADQAPMWVWLTDKEGDVLYTNTELLEFHDLTDYTEYTGSVWQQKVHPEDIELGTKLYIEAVTLHQSFSFESRVINAKTQQYEWFFIKGVPRMEAGEFTGFIGTGVNINEQKRLTKELEEKVISRTAALKASEEKFFKLFNFSPISTAFSDAHTGEILMVNDAFTNIFGYSREETLHKTSAELRMLQPALRKTAIKELKANGQLHNREMEYTKKSGEVFFALTSAESIMIEDKEYFICAYNDISDRRKAEKSIEQKNTELEKMNKELESFAYISSHDLQEPLRKIQTFASRIISKEVNNLSAQGKDMFNRIQDSAERMQTLIQDLLAYSRSNTAEGNFETTALNEIIADVKDNLEEELNEKHATIEVNQLCDADIIPFQFRQLMHNLISNSLKFSNPKHPPHIKIKCQIANGIKFNNEKLLPQKKYCHISISDNGIGFEQQYSEKIFEVFQRLHGKSEYNGTGIGLSIVNKIVENHHGFITATGELNKGATFDIYIPAA